MLLVVASQRDRIAARAVEYWGPDQARLLTCGDLSRPGWRYQPGRVERSVAVAGGQRMRAAAIDGVLVRLPYVPMDDLADIVPAERAYVSQEMTAFLTAWLTELRCPVLNRPTAESLGGPGWGKERWFRLARGLGLAVRARARPSVSVTLVGERGFGSALAVAQARELAQAAGTSLLDVHFDDALRVVSVDPWPDVGRPEIADAVLDYVRGA